MAKKPDPNEIKVSKYPQSSHPDRLVKIRSSQH